MAVICFLFCGVLGNGGAHEGVGYRVVICQVCGGGWGRVWGERGESVSESENE